MIELGLARIGRLLTDTPQPWRAVHVAGTNGKGSICAYIATILKATGLRCGRFTSPHVIDTWDGIEINGNTVPRSMYKTIERRVRQRSARDGIGATEFEILTATAFEIFNKARIDIAVVETGLGGRLDATNILKHKAVTVISKVGLDHQMLLGNTIEEIAKHKAGIMRPSVPCILDSTNPLTVQRVVQEHAKEIGTKVLPSSKLGTILQRPQNSEFFRAPHQWDNFACAYSACRTLCRGLALPDRFFKLLRGKSLPARLQSIAVKSAGRRQRLLLDGAHNPQSAEALGSFVDQRFRKATTNRVTWLIGVSGGKEFVGILKPLIREGDAIVAVEFGPVQGMPWVTPTPSPEILEAVESLGVPNVLSVDGGDSVDHALRQAIRIAGHGPLVVAGSLYLASDILRFRRRQMRMDWLYMHANHAQYHDRKAKRRSRSRARQVEKGYRWILQDEERNARQNRSLQNPL